MIFSEEASVYCAVRPGPLNKMDYVSSLKVNYASRKLTKEISILVSIVIEYYLLLSVTTDDNRQNVQ